MKKEIDRDGRILYKFSHSTAKGGNMYVRKAEIIRDTAGLRNALTAISRKYALIDPTIRIYDNIFFLFFHMPKSLAMGVLLDSIDRNIKHFGDWDDNYVCTGVYDLQNKFLRKDLEKWGFDYDKG